jgi:hypothetical protein
MPKLEARRRSSVHRAFIARSSRANQVFQPETRDTVDLIEARA